MRDHGIKHLFLSLSLFLPLSLSLFLSPSLPPSSMFNVDPSLNIVQRLFYLYISSLQYRFRYYFIFVLNDSVNNAAGLGFEGYDSDNNPKWGLASNVDIIAMETSMNIRQSINAWNITTARWLRRYCLYIQYIYAESASHT